MERGGGLCYFLNRMMDLSELDAAISGVVLLPDSDAYLAKIQSVWNAVISKYRPAAFVRVKSKEDVAQVVKFCVRNKVSLA